MKRFQSQIAGSILLVNILLSTLVATTKIPFDSDINAGGSISSNSNNRLIDSINNYKPYHSNHNSNSNDNPNDNSKAALGVLLRALIDESIDGRLSELTNDGDNDRDTIRRLIEANFYNRRLAQKRNSHYGFERRTRVVPCEEEELANPLLAC